jgi:hypothetical protein
MKLKKEDVDCLSPNQLVTAVLQQYDSSFSTIHANMWGVVDYTLGGRAYTRAFEILAIRREQLDHEVRMLTRAYHALQQEAKSDDG